MFIVPNPLPTDKRALQDLATQATNSLLPSYGGNFIRADRAARAQYPQLFQAIRDAVFPESSAFQPTISNAQRATITQPAKNTAAFDLPDSTTLDEHDAIWKATGGDASKAPEAFEALCGLAQKNRSLSYPAAKSAVETRFPNLKVKKDSVLAARKIGAPLPDPIANDLSTAGVRQIYAEAVAEHLRKNPQDGAIDSHRKVMAAHPTLAAAMRKKRNFVVNPDSDSDDDDTDPPAKNGAQASQAGVKNPADSLANDRPVLSYKNLVLANDNRFFVGTTHGPSISG